MYVTVIHLRIILRTKLLKYAMYLLIYFKLGDNATILKNDFTTIKIEIVLKIMQYIFWNTMRNKSPYKEKFNLVTQNINP